VIKANNKQLSVYPIPTSDILTFEGLDSSTKYILEIYDLKGDFLKASFKIALSHRLMSLLRIKGISSTR